MGSSSMKQITKYEYFIMAAKRRFFTKKQNVYSAYSYIQNSSEIEFLVGGIRTQENSIHFTDEENEEYVIIDAVLDKPLFGRDEELTIKKGDLRIAKTKDIKTTYGAALLNVVLFEYFLPDLIEYQEGKVSPYAIDAMLIKLRKDGTINLAKYLDVVGACDYLTGFNNIFVQSATPEMLELPPNIKKRRDEVLKDIDKLKDPIYAAKVTEELVGMMVEYYKGTDSEAYFTSKKAIPICMKTMLLFNGSVDTSRGDGSTVFIPESLDDGLTMENFATSINNGRSGSIKRGGETALGGEAVKWIIRILAEYLIAAGDCGTTLYSPTLITSFNVGEFDGRYHIVNGKTIPLTEATVKANLGKIIKLRSVKTCKKVNEHVCAICCGDAIADDKAALVLQGIEVTSVLMGIFMAAMHGTALKTVEYLPEESIL